MKNKNVLLYVTCVSLEYTRFQEIFLFFPFDLDMTLDFSRSMCLRSTVSINEYKWRNERTKKNHKLPVKTPKIENKNEGQLVFRARERNWVAAGGVRMN